MLVVSKVLEKRPCTGRVIEYDDVDKGRVGGQEVNVVVVCRSGVLQYK